MLKIEKVASGSIGEELGLAPGDAVTEFNGVRVADILDYVFYDGQTDFTMTARTAEGEIEFEIEKAPEETLGLEFGAGGELGTIRCKNDCAFCFVRQLPKGMRKSLYVKDDDWRLSLVSGNFVTLTNLSGRDLARITSMRMSPLYISVHSLVPETRVKLMKNPQAARIGEYLTALEKAGITMHCQIVLCPGVNDGKDLACTLEKLAAYEHVESCAIVPVGLTKHREGLAPLRTLTEAEAAAAIEEGERANRRRGERFVFCSDEMYLIAKKPLLSYNEYGDFIQLENGVGLIAKLEREFEDALPGAGRLAARGTLITGVSAAPLIEKLAARLMGRIAGLDLQVAPVTNDFFGRTITVAGLVTGRDIAAQLAGRNLGDFAVIPRVMLREFTTVFLDDLSVSDVEAALGVPLRVADMDGESFVSTILQGARK